MRFFNYKKEAEERRNKKQEIVNKMADFRKIGEKFYYCNIQMTVEGYWSFGGRSGFYPSLNVAYKNDKGELIRTTISPHLLEVLIKENS